MHILLIHQAFTALDEPGGTRHHEICRYLASCGHSTTVIASPISYLTGKTKGGALHWVDKQVDGTRVTILRAYTYPALHRSFLHRVFSFLSFMASSFIIGIGVRKVDLVWGTSPPIFQAGTAWALARLKRVPFLFEVRDLWPAFAVEVGVLRQPLFIRAAEWFERFLYRNADKVIVNSPGFIDHVTERGAQRVELVPNGADARMFDPSARGDEFRSVHKLEGKFIALYAGAHGLSNDLEVILEAAEILRTRSDITILLVGDGKEKPALQARARELGLMNVQFINSIPKVEMPKILSAADACIAILKPIPMYGTVYPNKVFDYMAAGRPVILAIQGVIRELLEYASAGLPVTPGDPQALAQAIGYLADHPEEAREMGLNGRRCVEGGYDRPILAGKMATLLESLVNSLPRKV